MQIYAMRHGESEYNVLGLCNDDPARNVRLTETGKQQADAAAGKLRRIPFDAIYCSELPRARQTAEIVGQHHARAIECQAKLNDIRSGCDGKPVEEYFRRIAEDRLHARVDSGETLLEHKQRVMDFLEWLSMQQNLRYVLLVAHEETLRVFKAYAEMLSEEAMLGLGFKNCEIFEFTL